MTEPAPALLAMLRPRARRVDLLVGLLLLLLGFGLVVQVRSTRSEGVLTSARQEDLVQILDELGNRSDRLRQEITSLQTTRASLTSGSGADKAALAEAARRTQLLGVVAGTVAATGPGVLVRITDPKTQVSAAVLLDALEELRNAGAEAVELEGTGSAGTVVTVRVVAQTFLVDEPDGVLVDGTRLRAPYRYVVVGDPSTLAGAIAIPGGVEDAVRQVGGAVSVARTSRARVDALRALTTDRYARPQ